MSISSLPDEELLKRAVKNCRSNGARRGEKHPRWVAVADCFVLGRTYANELCIRFGLNPDEMVKR